MKTYAVILFESAADELSPLCDRWLTRDGHASFLRAKTIDPNGMHYFHMTLEDTALDGNVVTFELQIPHSSIKAIFYAEDFKRLGFTAS